MEYNITVPGKGEGKKITLSDETFAQNYNEALIHEVVTAHLAGARAGTKAQKTRSEVSGGGRKPWRQKGTGRARAGTIRSPIWRSGGITFAAKPRDYTKKVNRKAHRVAMRSILSELARQQRLVVVDSFTLEQPKTKLAITMLADLGISSALIITGQTDINVTLALRNIPHIQTVDANNINPVDLIAFEKILVTVDGLKKIEEHLK